MEKTTISLLVSIYFVLVTHAQLPIYKHFTIEDGLPSNEIHMVFQDSKGCIWIATNHGVGFYDGYKFITYTTADGLTGNTVFQIVEDKKQRIWFSTYSNGFCFYENGKIYPHPLNKQIIQRLQPKWAADYFVDQGDTLWFTKLSLIHI